MTGIQPPAPFLSVDALSIGKDHGDRTTLVDAVSFSVRPGECLGLVGESGSGKSLSLRSILGLLPSGVAQTGGRLWITDERGSRDTRPENLRGHGVSMVFQEPMSSLNPTLRIGDLVAVGARQRGLNKKEAQAAALELLREVGIPDPERRMRAWPHELSGGLRQRVMIAMALSVEPKLLLCDEPTTALDTTVQDQILTLLERLRRDRGLAVIFVSHDLGVVSRIADSISVMYAGRIVESGPTAELIADPRHPYTRALLESMPNFEHATRRLPTIPGAPPAAGSWPVGCRFAPRCRFATEACRDSLPELVAIPNLPDTAATRSTACIRDTELRGETV